MKVFFFAFTFVFLSHYFSVEAFAAAAVVPPSKADTSNQSIKLAVQTAYESYLKKQYEKQPDVDLQTVRKKNQDAITAIFRSQDELDWFAKFKTADLISSEIEVWEKIIWLDINALHILLSPKPNYAQISKDAPCYNDIVALKVEPDSWRYCSPNRMEEIQRNDRANTIFNILVMEHRLAILHQRLTELKAKGS